MFNITKRAKNELPELLIHYHLILLPLSRDYNLFFTYFKLDKKYNFKSYIKIFLYLNKNLIFKICRIHFLYILKYVFDIYHGIEGSILFYFCLPRRNAS